MATRTIRGATTVAANQKQEILSATSEILKKIIYVNQIQVKDIISVFFTSTRDLTVAYPAEAAREMGINKAGLMCLQELFVDGSLEKCIRVMIMVESQKEQDEMKHIYMKNAENLRKDLVPKKHYSIAIDGPNGAGKSTIAKAVAKELGFVYVDTGAMYRATGYYCIKNGIDLDDKESISKALKHIDISLSYEDGSQKIFLNDKDVSEIIRSQDGANGASKVAVIPEVRENLVAMQQRLSQNKNIVMDGRDIGTKVLPHADLKIYLDADIDVRTNRRLNELTMLKIETNFEKVKKEIEMRDKRDMDREVSPLKKAEDAFVLDATNLDIEGVCSEIVKMFKRVI